MAAPDYEYWGLMAQTWDFFRGDTSQWPDRFFYLDLIRAEGQPVLDVGCASGRILLDFAQRGIQIDGVDNSPELLEIGRTRAAAVGLAPTTYLQPMQDQDLPRRYQVILVPSSSFQLLTDPALARRAMGRFYAHLRPGGVLAMSFMHFWHAGDPLDTGWTLAAEKVRPDDGATLRRWSRSTYDPAHQWESTQDRYEVERDGRIVQSEEHSASPATRWYTQEEARQVYLDAGFTDVRLYHEFTWEPASPDDTLFTAVGRRPT
jgi:SAM-dependent methyltransferase